MKRIAVLAALVITMLAVPAAAAMAGTSGSSPGYGQPPRQIQIACPAPFRLHNFHKGHFTITIKGKPNLQALLKARRRGKPSASSAPTSRPGRSRRAVSRRSSAST